MSSVLAPSTARSAPRVVSAHQVRVDSFEPGATTLEMTRARARSRCRPAGPSRAGSPSFAAMACTAATCPCGSDPVMCHRPPGRDQPLALQRGLDRPDRLGRQRRQVRQRLMPDLAALAVGPAHQHRLIHPPLPGLRHIGALVPGYVHRAAACCHTTILAGNPGKDRNDTPISWLHLIAANDGTSACQSSNLYVELRQLRLRPSGPRRRRRVSRPAARHTGARNDQRQAREMQEQAILPALQYEAAQDHPQGRFVSHVMAYGHPCADLPRLGWCLSEGWPSANMAAPHRTMVASKRWAGAAKRVHLC